MAEDWEHSATLDMVMAARKLNHTTRKGLEFRMEQLDPTGEDRDALYYGDPDDDTVYELSISEVGVLYTAERMLARCDSLLWELERRARDGADTAAVPDTQ